MKNLVAFISLATLAFSQPVQVLAKSEYALTVDTVNINTSCPKAYIGLSAGINNPNGLLGFSFEVPIRHDISFSAGAGASMWGANISAEARYYMRPCQRGWSLAIGISHNSGRTNFKPPHTFNTTSGPQDIGIDLKPMTNINFAIQRSWNMGHKQNKFYTQMGWSVPFRPSSFKQTGGSPITPQEGDRISSWAPGNTFGGFMLGVGIYFGVH